MKVQHLYRHDLRPGGLFTIPDAPESVLWDLTWRCNQSCRYCYLTRAARTRPGSGRSNRHCPRSRRVGRE